MKYRISKRLGSKTLYKTNVISNEVRGEILLVLACSLHAYLNKISRRCASLEMTFFIKKLPLKRLRDIRYQVIGHYLVFFFAWVAGCIFKGEKVRIDAFIV
jgi:hypothetical protein